ncbi:MAG: hypothetical protein WCV72_00575 [Patescibacteria group bacterium]
MTAAEKNVGSIDSGTDFIDITTRLENLEGKRDDALQEYNKLHEASEENPNDPELKKLADQAREEYLKIRTKIDELLAIGCDGVA